MERELAVAVGRVAARVLLDVCVLVIVNADAAVAEPSGEVLDDACLSRAAECTKIRRGRHQQETKKEFGNKRGAKRQTVWAEGVRRKGSQKNYLLQNQNMQLLKGRLNADFLGICADGRT